jgi:hypothetical protein
LDVLQCSRFAIYLSGLPSETKHHTVANQPGTFHKGNRINTFALYAGTHCPAAAVYVLHFGRSGAALC